MFFGYFLLSHGFECHLLCLYFISSHVVFCILFSGTLRAGKIVYIKPFVYLWGPFNRKIATCFVSFICGALLIGKSPHGVSFYFSWGPSDHSSVHSREQEEPGRKESAENSAGIGREVFCYHVVIAARSLLSHA